METHKIEVNIMSTEHIKVNEKTREGTDVSPSDVATQSNITNITNKEPLPPDKFPNIRRGNSGDIHILTTIENLKHLLDGYGITVMFDNFTKKEIINVPGLNSAPETAENTALVQIMSLASLHRMNVGLIPDFVSAIASQRQFNGPRVWITSKPWDKKSRLTAFYDTLTVPKSYSEALRNTLLFRWILSVVAAAYLTTGFRSRGVLVIQGAQGIGKTTWVLNLLSGDEFRAKYIKTGHHLDAANKDSMLGAISHWIVELGELDSSFKKDAARLKGFLTDGFDKVRLPYARRDSHYPRRTVFCASVNESTFLVDPTGNTRFWTIPVTAINYDHGIDMQQLFAEVFTLLGQGERWWLSPEEDAMLELANKEFRSVNAVRDMIYDALDFNLPKEKWLKMTAIDVLRSIGIDKPTNTQCKDAASTFRELEQKIGTSTRSQGKTRWSIPIKSAQTYRNYR